MCRIYILLSQTNTVLARSIRKCTGTEFSHTSLSLDGNYEEMYSFTRKYPNNPVIGQIKRETFDTGVFGKSKECLCQIYTAKVTKEQHDQIRAKIECFLNSEKPFKFNNLGLFACWFKIIYPRKYKRVCSQFVAECLAEACPEITMPKNFWIMQPEDFKFLTNVDMIYRGKMKDIPLGLSREQIAEQIEKYKDYNPHEFSKKKRKKWD